MAAESTPEWWRPSRRMRLERAQPPEPRTRVRATGGGERTSPPGLVGRSLGSEGDWHRAVVDAYVEWFGGLPVQLWLTVNAAEPLGAGSWRFVLHQVHDLVERVGDLRDETAWWVRLSATATGSCAICTRLGWGPPALRALRRVGPNGLVGDIERIVVPLHAAWRPFVQPDNRAAVTLRAVRRFGNGTDSLTRYIVKYEVKDREAVHIESGDIGRFLPSAKGVAAHAR